MAQKKPAFRFRLPWLQFGSAPRPTPRPPSQPARNTTNTPFLIAISESKPASQPSGTTNPPAASAPSRGSSAPSQTQPSRIEPEPSSPSRATELVVTSQPASPSPSTELPVITSQPTSPSRATELQITSRPTSPAHATQPHVTSRPTSPVGAAQPRVTSQPASPPRATESHVASQPASPPRATEARVPSQPASPPRTTEPNVSSKSGSPPRAIEPGVTSQPASPPRVTDEPRVTSQPASPPRVTDEPRVTSQPASPPRVTDEPRVSSQPASPPRAIEPHVTSQPTSPPRATKPRVTSQPASPSKIAEETLKPSPKPTDTQSPVSDKGNSATPTTQPLLQPVELPSKPDTRADAIHEAKVQQPEIKLQPSEESGLAAAATGLTEDQETPEPSKKSENSTDDQNSKPFRELKSVETKEVMQKTRDRDHYEAKQIDKEMLSTKEQPSTAFRPLKGQTDKLKPSDKTSQQRNKRVVSDSHFKPATSNEQHLPLQKEIKDSILKLVNKKTAVGGSKQRVEGRPVNVITLAGENTGASMQRGSDPSKKEGSLHIRRGYKTNPEGSAKATTDAAGESSRGRKSKDTKTVEDQSTKVYANSNVQCINNSVLSDSSTVERSPGVHLQFPRFPVEPVKSNDQAGPLEIQKAEFNTTLAEKLTYEPQTE